uniref:Uncharacterized protein n=1 Tax=Amphora coffeiformis TaxID=265554 RepID=A0A7S3KX30_9STRA|mmetsp:Transcript_18903/g.35874  ORF Transcript_18903/g.35874 Transcript_18903/m.35874 type:complete len:509 (+) Transcript_18903:108-1634(+)
MKQIHNELGFLENPPDNVAKEVRRRPVKTGTYIARLIQLIEDSLTKLGVRIQEDIENNLRMIEHMAIIIHDSMSVSTRNYHSVQHVFDVAEGVADDPIAILAAIFHDCVYYHVDGRVSDLQRQHLKIYEDSLVKEDKLPEYHVKGDRGSSDTLLRMVECVFGYPHNTVVTHRNGLNEFLSAVICVRQLEPFLPLRELAEIACCIEMTIPFRPNITDQYGNELSCGDRLFLQMSAANSQFNLGMNDEQVVEAVQRAVRISNEDVSNFGSEDVLWFLDNTWSLLPETNEALRQQFLYSVEDFQFAVHKMYGFFSFLKPEVVFTSFRGVPAPEVSAEREKFTTLNLKLGRKYVGAKLLSISVLAAFAELTGGDAPISLFMGDLPSRHRNSRRSQSPFAELPKPLIDGNSMVDPTVYKILSEGRRGETSFDIRQSPLAAFLYGHLGDEKVDALLKTPHEKWPTLYPMSKETAKALLRELPKENVGCLGTALSSVAFSRKEVLLAVVKDITAD